MSSQPIAYTIDHEGLRLDIALAPIDRLRAHEETIPEQLRVLGDRMLRDGVQSAPIIVDRGTYVVLDGMHRTAVMRRLGCRLICVCLVDYFDPSIRVQRWCRVVPGPLGAEDLEEALDALDIGTEPYEPSKSPDEEGGFLLVYRGQKRRLIRSGEDLLQAFRRSRELENKLTERGHRIAYCTEAEAAEGVASGAYEAALYPPKVGKSQVVEAAEQGRVFAPKATRHLLPARPVQVNVPLKLLRDKEMSLEEANAWLRDALSHRRLVRYESGTEWMGRTYDEVLYVFES